MFNKNIWNLIEAEGNKCRDHPEDRNQHQNDECSACRTNMFSTYEKRRQDRSMYIFYKVTRFPIFNCEAWTKR